MQINWRPEEDHVGSKRGDRLVAQKRVKKYFKNLNICKASAGIHGNRPLDVFWCDVSPVSPVSEGQIRYWYWRKILELSVAFFLMMPREIKSEILMGGICDQQRSIGEVSWVGSYLSEFEQKRCGDLNQLSVEFFIWWVHIIQRQSQPLPLCWYLSWYGGSWDN